MDNKDVKLLKELFKNTSCKTGADIISHFRERNNVLQTILCRPVTPEHLVGLSKSDALLRILTPADISLPLNLGIYHSFFQDDMSLLNDALYSYNRLSYHRLSLISSGTDHSKYLTNVIESFAGNDVSLVAEMFPESKGLTKTGHRFSVVVSNLLISMLYKRQGWVEHSILDAETYTRQKIGVFDRAVVKYLICLSNGQADEASQYLLQASNYYKRAKWLHDFKSPFLAVFGLFLHGLYNLAYHIVPRNNFEQIEEPFHTVFWKPFTIFQRGISFERGTVFLTFVDEIEALNSIYK